MVPKSGSYQVSATPVTVFAHLLAITVAVLVLVWLLKFQHGLAFRSVNKAKILNVHVLLMVIGFILFAGEAIMAYKTIPARRKTKKGVHLILHLIALVCGIVGVYAAFKFHHEAGIADMYTLHSWFGMVAICLFGLQWLLALFSYVFPGAEMSTRASFLPWHAFAGLAIFFLGICTAEMGFLQRFLILGLYRDQQALIANFSGLLLFLFAVAVGLTIVLP